MSASSSSSSSSSSSRHVSPAVAQPLNVPMALVLPVASCTSDRPLHHNDSLMISYPTATPTSNTRWGAVGCHQASAHQTYSDSLPVTAPASVGANAAASSNGEAHRRKNITSVHPSSSSTIADAATQMGFLVREPASSSINPPPSRARGSNHGGASTSHSMEERCARHLEYH